MQRSGSIWRPAIRSRPRPIPATLAVLMACAWASAHGVENEPPAPPDSIPGWIRPLSLQGTLEGEYHWTENSSPQLSSAPRSSLYLRRAELAAGGRINNWVEVLLVANSEYIGDTLKPGDEHLALDEGHLDLQREGFPPYLVLGKRTQPFGAFENHMITDPLTQDGYEVNRVGVTLGASGPLDLDLSATGITGAEQIDHLLGSGLFDTTGIRRGATDSVTVQSLIVAGRFSPMKNLVTVFGSYLNEPGVHRRNSTADLGLTFASRENRVFLDVEYVKALRREVSPGAPRAYKDGAFSATAGYATILSRPGIHRGGTFRGRRSRTHDYPFVLAVRYEHFDDDGFAVDRNTWSTRGRVSLGGIYTFARSSISSIYGMFEVRRSTFRTPNAAATGFAPSNNEVLVRLGIVF
jgi:hypothetical protein